MLMKDIWAIQRYGFIYISGRLKGTSVNGGDFMVLDYLEQNSEVTQDEIAQYMMLDKATITKSMKRLLALGYIERKADEHDRRKNNVSLTEKGRQVHKKTKSVAFEWRDIVLDGFKETEMEQFAYYCSKAAINAQDKYKKFEQYSNETFEGGTDE